MWTRAGVLYRALAGALALGAAAACAAGGTAPRERVVTPAQDGESLALRPGGRLLVRLPVQRGTGFSWAPIEPPALLRLDETREEAPAQAMPGAQGSQVFAFTAAEPGQAALRFAYRRPWTHDAPARRFGITVEVAR